MTSSDGGSVWGEGTLSEGGENVLSREKSAETSLQKGGARDTKGKNLLREKRAPLSAERIARRRWQQKKEEEGKYQGERHRDSETKEAHPSRSIMEKEGEFREHCHAGEGEGDSKKNGRKEKDERFVVTGRCLLYQWEGTGITGRDLVQERGCL